MTRSFVTKSPEETQKIGEQIGKNLIAGDFVALIGDLGSGKTCLTQGLARGVGIGSDRVVNSPSYTLINEYDGKIPIYHIDLYRLKSGDEIFDLGLDDYIDGDGICVVEWSDRIDQLPKNRIEIRLAMLSENERKIELSAQRSLFSSAIAIR